MTAVLFGPEIISVEFEVHGTPAPQGSKSAFLTSLAIVRPYPRVVRCPGCNVPLRGSFRLVEAAKGVAEWRKAVAQHARIAMRGRVPMRGALIGYVDLAVGRPKNHYRTGKSTAHLLKPDSPDEPVSYGGGHEGDLSKLLRATEDAMSGIVWADDGQVVEYSRLRMHYAGEKRDGLAVPGARIVVSQIGGPALTGGSDAEES
jgi:Holliday junction resolvase RusA-like endonuclease